MTEIYQDIDKELREEAQVAWQLATTLTPAHAANFLSSYTLYNHTPEEQDFLRFYFNLQMEKMKNE